MGRKTDPYREGRTSPLNVTDTVNKPFVIPLTPEFVRELADDPEAPAALVERAKGMRARGEALPGWLVDRLIQIAESPGEPRTVHDNRVQVWRRAIDLLKLRFGLSEHRARVLVAQDGAIETTFSAVDQAMKRKERRKRRN